MNFSNNNITFFQKLQYQLSSRGSGAIIVESLFMILINLSTFGGNLLVLTALVRNPSLRQNICNLYIMILSLSDFLMAVLCIPLSSAATVVGRWPAIGAYCQVQGFLVLLFCAVSLQTLAITAVNRYYRTTRTNAVYRRYFTLKSTKITIVILWITAFFAPLPYVAMGEEFIFHPGKVFCTHNYASLVVGYGAFLVLVYVVIPVIVIIYCYTKVFVCVRRHNANFRVHVADSAQERPGQGPRLSVDEINITWTLLAVVLGFMICWTPVVVIDLIDFVNGDWKLSRQTYFSYTCFGFSSTAINPFIYGIMNKHFRKEYAKVLPFIKDAVSRSNDAVKSASPEGTPGDRAGRDGRRGKFSDPLKTHSSDVVNLSQLQNV